MAKQHYQGTCPACRQLVRCTADGRAYRHFGGGWVQPETRPCLGSGRPADDVTDGTVDGLSFPKGALL